MSEPILCVCGHPSIDHCTISGCPSCLGKGTGERLGKACGCPLFRPCLPWPDSGGYLWWTSYRDGEYLVNCKFTCGSVFTDEEVQLDFEGELYTRAEFESKYGPARFVRLIEESPFKTK